MLYFFMIILLILAFVWKADVSCPVVGNFVINKTDPSKELFSLYFERDIDEFEDAKFVSFNVLER